MQQQSGPGRAVLHAAVAWPTGGPGDGTGFFSQVIDTAKAAGILAIWQTVIRDLLLLSFPIEEFVANEVALDELKQIKLPLNKLLSARQALEQGLKHIAANVNPRLVLENVSLQI